MLIKEERPVVFQVAPDPPRHKLAEFAVQMSKLMIVLGLGLGFGDQSLLWLKSSGSLQRAKSSELGFQTLGFRPILPQRAHEAAGLGKATTEDAVGSAWGLGFRAL